MGDLLAARGQMAMSLGFHILFAVAGMAMPVLMVAAEWLHRRTNDPAYGVLAKQWAKGTAILFATGAVSGTVLSFELGLLWPTFMRHAGPIIGLPFSLEGFAFFLEAIFLGVFLYGRGRVPPAMHLASGVGVALSGLASGVFVMSVNAWMNTPAGFTQVDGELTHIDFWAAFFNPAFPTQAAHMAVAAYASVGFAVLGIHAWGLLRSPTSAFHRAGAKLALAMALIAAPMQLLTGDLAAKHLAEHQPVKLAAAEGLFHTERGAPLALGGWPDAEAGELRWAVEVPYALSILAHLDPQAEVQGLLDFPRDQWPPLAPVHFCFQLMVACGMALLGLCAVAAWLWARRWRQGGGPWQEKRFLQAAVFAAPLGLVALEAGWVVTEVGRQPWIIHGVMRTAEAVTPMPGLMVPFAVLSGVYLLLGVIVVSLLRAYVFRATFGSGGQEGPQR